MSTIIQKLYKRLKILPYNRGYVIPYKKTTTFIKSRPLTSFFISLLFLFLVIVAGNIFNKPKPQNPPTPIVKAVRMYNIGETPKATFQAKIEKSGVIKIVALTPGIVQTIFVNEGDSVYKGTQLVTLSTNYQGGNAPALQAQMAQVQYTNAADTLSQQKNALQKQRDIANINRDSFSDMQTIASQSASETNSLINSNQGILDQLNQQLTIAQNSGASQSATIQQQSAVNQLQGAQNQLRQALRSLQTQTDNGKPQGRLANVQHDLAIEQLNIQEKSLELNKEVSRLQADLAEVNAATMFPVSPFSGIVERIYVRVGQQVSPGTPLAEITATDPKTTAVVDVPERIAKNISSFGISTIYLNNKSYSVRPTFISTEATNGSLYSIIYTISSDANIPVTDGEYVKISIPIGSVNTSAVVPFVPLDAIYQTQDTSYLLVVKNHKAETREVTLGNVFGSYAEITQGLQTGDQVILDRNIAAGDRVTFN